MSLFFLVFYLDKAEVLRPNVDDSVYVQGTLGVHHVDRVSPNKISLFLNRYAQLTI